MPKLKRTTLLTCLLLGVTVLTLAEDSLTNVVQSPFVNQTKTLDALRRKVATADRELARIEVAQRSLRNANRQSLPPDPSVAATLYQNWLIELANTLGLTNAIVTPSQPLQEEGVGHCLSVALQADTTAPQFGQFLDRFYKMPLLHRVSLATLTEASSPTKGLLRVTLNCEALSLAGSKPRQTLLCEDVSGTLTVRSSTDSSEKNALAGKNVLSLVTLIQTSRPFHRIEPAPPKPDTTNSIANKSIPPINPLTQIRFVGIWQNGTRKEAWFFDEVRRREFVFTEHNPLEIESLKGRIIFIEDGRLGIEVFGQVNHLSPGQRLSNLGYPSVP